MVADYRSHLHSTGDERVIEKSSSAGIVYLTLTRMNYTEWSLVMQVNLQAARLWDVIESGVGGNCFAGARRRRERCELLE
jgi:hypothetical protein